MARTTDDEVRQEFRRLVNLSPTALERWLDRDESKAVGTRRSGATESVGHRSGRRIVDLLQTRSADLTDDDVRHMRKVTGYIKRHLAQRPDGDVTETRWRSSLMNWGHDPLKD